MLDQERNKKFCRGKGEPVVLPKPGNLLLWNNWVNESLMKLRWWELVWERRAVISQKKKKKTVVQSVVEDATNKKELGSGVAEASGQPRRPQ